MSNSTNNIYDLPIYKKESSSEQKQSYLKKRLSALNEGKQIKVRVQKNSKDKFHLYLDYHFNYKRERQFLKLYVTEKRTPDNDQKIREASLLKNFGHFGHLFRLIPDGGSHLLFIFS